MFVALLALLVSGLSAQDPAPHMAPRPLKPSSTRILEVPPFSAYGEPHCDDNLAMYYHLATGSYRQTAILRLSQSGNESTLYKLPDDLAADTAFMDFSVTPDGNVKALVEDSKGHSIAIDFNSAGNVSSQVQLDLPEHVAGEHIAVFPNGTMLFSGHYRDDAPADARGKKYAGLFQPSGKLLKKLNEPGQDTTSDTKNELKDKDQQNGTDHFPAGGTTIGKDGNVYLLTANKVLAISASGQVQKQIPFSLPDSGFSAVRVQYSEGLLVISFAKPGNPEVQFRYLVVNAQDGTPMGLYEPTEGMGNDNVCFSRRDGFLFLTLENNRPKLVTAPLR